MYQVAVISFLTVFNIGYGDPGVVAGNHDDRANQLRMHCLRLAIVSEELRKEFDELHAKLTPIRNELLAHSDGKAHQVTVKPTHASIKTAWNSVSDEDAIALHRFAVLISDAVRTIDLVAFETALLNPSAPHPAPPDCGAG
jgi:hypothetical protein